MKEKSMTKFVKSFNEFVSNYDTGYTYECECFKDMMRITCTNFEGFGNLIEICKWADVNRLDVTAVSRSTITKGVPYLLLWRREPLPYDYYFLL